METLSATSFVADPATGTISGYAAVFGSVARGARGPTVFKPHSFEDSLRETAGRLPLLFEHRDTVGVVTRARETARGLEFAGKLSNTTLGADVRELLKDGAITGVSVGFEPDAGSITFERHASGERVRVVRRARLSEISVVAFPADPLARVASVHSALHEMHAGRVLSAENFRKVQRAQELLSEVLATEPRGGTADVQQRLAQRLAEAEQHGVRLPTVRDFFRGVSKSRVLES